MSSISSAATLVLKLLSTGDPQFISGYVLNCLELDIIVGSMSFPSYRYVISLSSLLVA